MDAAGAEFHYTVTAVTVEYNQYLCFQLDPGSDRIRDVLQKVREQALAEGDDLHAGATVEQLASAEQKVQQAADDLHLLVRRLLGEDPADARLEPWKSVSAACDELVRRVDKLVRAASPPAPRDRPQS